jgi:hypothetical protein
MVKPEEIDRHFNGHRDGIRGKHEALESLIFWRCSPKYVEL